jgi:ribose 5-phosphate isomerase B
MNIVVGADHGGFQLKTILADYVRTLGHTVHDVGTYSPEATDYPDYAKAVAQRILAHGAERGIVVCGSGVGACVAANKVPGIRAAICHDTFSAHQGVEDDDMNVLCLGARIIGTELAKEIVRTFLSASFSHAERHVRRLGKVNAIEKEYMKKREE